MLVDKTPQVNTDETSITDANKRAAKDHPPGSTSTIVGTMGTNGTKKNTGKPNTDAEDKIDDKPIDVETPTKDTSLITTSTSDSARKLWKGQKLTDDMTTGKKSNLILGESTMYTTNRIYRSPSTSEPKRTPAARESDESG